jgi:hypothetical protein
LTPEELQQRRERLLDALADTLVTKRLAEVASSRPAPAAGARRRR